VKKKLALGGILVVLAVALGIGGWLLFGRTVDISEYGDEPIRITGLTDEDFYVTPKELLALDCVSVTASGGTEKSSGVNGTGPELNTFLAQYGKTTADFTKIRILCKDDYTVVLRGEYLTDDYQIVLAVRKIREPLPEELQPMRLIIPEGESGKWAYGVTEIQFVE
jgi:hypothetical protein